MIEMSEFHLFKEGEDKLWVDTPFPVTNLVWAYFVLEIFPSFNSIDLPEDVLSRRNIPEHKTVRCVNRDDTKLRYEIADGQLGHYLRYTFLPDDRRVHLEEHTNGVIYCPDFRSDYLIALEEELRQNGEMLANRLNDMRSQSIEVIKSCFTAISDKTEALDTSISYQTLVSSLADSLERQLGIHLGHGSRPTIGGVHLPSEPHFHIPYYSLNLVSATVRQYLLNLGNTLHQPFSGTQLEKPTLEGLSASLSKQYQHLTT